MRALGRAGELGNPLVRSPPQVLLLMTVLSSPPNNLISFLLYLEALYIVLLEKYFSSSLYQGFSDLHSST